MLSKSPPQEKANCGMYQDVEANMRYKAIKNGFQRALVRNVRTLMKMFRSRRNNHGKMMSDPDMMTIRPNSSAACHALHHITTARQISHHPQHHPYPSSPAPHPSSSSPSTSFRPMLCIPPSPPTFSLN